MTATSTNGDDGSVSQSLRSAPVAASHVLEQPGLLPAAAGFYCWWSRRDAIGGVPYVAHPDDGDLSLLYVGISPGREGSRQTIRSRVIGNHLKGNVGSSTLRFVLAALLMETLALRPAMRGSKVALDAPDNAELSRWQSQHLLLTWCPRQRPWEIESPVIARLGPPLNSIANSANAFYPRVRAARAEFRRRAAVHH